MSTGTTKHPFRLDDDLWAACLAKSRRTGTTVVDVVRQRLEEWVNEEDTPEDDEPNDEELLASEK